MNENGHIAIRPYKCRKCSSIQAFTDGERLYFGERLVPGDPLSVMFTCTKCFACLLWKRTDYEDQVRQKRERMDTKLLHSHKM